MQLTQHQIDYCMECGVCTGSCPVSRHWSEFSPRQIIKRACIENPEEVTKRRELWLCLSCGRCYSRCPVEIDFPEFNRQQRMAARQQGNLPQESHHGVMQTVSLIQTAKITQSRTAWAADAGKFADKGEYFYFVGCLPYFEVTFRYLNLSPLSSAKSVLKILNKMGIEPVISNEERCCGHDAFWSGDQEKFEKLVRLNMEAIAASGAKTVIFSCPEGYHTFKHQYPKIVGNLPFDVVYLTEFLEKEWNNANFALCGNGSGAVTFHDPCRLGRLSGLYESPRKLLANLPETKLVEMERSRINAQCCGTSAWMECSSCSKATQVERICEAKGTGAGTLITACPKCQIHLTCAQEGTDLNMPVKDIFTYLGERLYLD